MLKPLLIAALLCLTVPVHAVQTTYDITQFGAIPDDGLDDGPAVNAVFNAHPTDAVLYSPPGVYDFHSGISKDGLSNVTIKSAPGSVWQKMPGFTSEYLIYTRFSSNFTIDGGYFKGLTASTGQFWGEQGVYCGSCNGFTVEGGTYENFGDAALRFPTSMADPVLGVNAFNITILANRFINIGQITMSSTENTHGGANGVKILYNTFWKHKGGIKMASRTPGSGNIEIIGNQIYSQPDVANAAAIELESVSDVLVKYNLVYGATGYISNNYTSTVAGINHFDWKNITFDSNLFKNPHLGIRFSNQAYKGDNLYSNTTGINITNNIFTNVTNGDTTSPVISMVNGPFSQSTVSGNVMTGVANGRYSYFQGNPVTYFNNVEN